MSDTVAFYGAGMLGSGFVQALRRRGVPVRVWNRTFEKAKALEGSGAQAFESAAETARGASRVHLCLRDDEAVESVLAAALPGIAKDAPIIDHTTTSPRGVTDRVQRFAREGRQFVHAPVFMGPQNALESTGLMMISGDPDLAERLRPLLEPMTGKLWYAGERADGAAVRKLLGNAMILAVIGGLRDAFALADRNGLDRDAAYGLFAHFNPGAQIQGRGKRMAEGDYEPTWTLEMAHKDARLMLESAGGAALPVLAAVEAELRAAMERDLGAKDLAAIAEL